MERRPRSPWIWGVAPLADCTGNSPIDELTGEPYAEAGPTPCRAHSCGPTQAETIMTPRKHITGPPCGTCGTDQFFAVTLKCVRCSYRRVGEKAAEAARVRNAERLEKSLPLTTPPTVKAPKRLDEQAAMQNVSYEDS